MSRSRIYQHKFTVVVYNEFADYNPHDLSSIEFDITDGDSIGDFNKVATEEVPTDKLHERLQAIGGDVEFFFSPFLEGED